MSSSSRRTGRGPVTSIAVWSSAHPRVALVLWAVVIAALTSVGYLVTARAATETETLTGQSRQTAELAEAAGYREAASELILVTGEFDADAAGRIGSELADTEHVESVAGPIVSDSDTALLYRVAIEGDPDTASERTAPLRATVTALAAEFDALTIRQTGAVSIADDFQAWLGVELDRATLVTIPTTLVILVIAFGAIVIAVLPIAVGAASVLAATGLWAAASLLIPDTGIVPHVIVLIGMAVGIDYALFYSRRYREQVHTGAGSVDATEVAARTAGHSIIVSGTAVALAMAGLLLVQETLYSGVAIGAILVVLIAMGSALTAMPALMRMLDRWIDTPRLPVLWRVANSGKDNRLLRAALRPVIRRPWIALSAGAIVLGLMAAPALTMKLSTTTIDDYPEHLASLQVYNEVRHEFPDTTSSARIVMTATASDETALRRVADDIARQAATIPALFGETDVPWVSDDDRTLVLDIAVPHESMSSEGAEAIHELRERIIPGALDGLSDAGHGVGGPIAAHVDGASDLAERMPWVIGIVIALTFGYMLAVYRSLAVALTTILLNIASTFASFGLLTLIFQHTWAETLLGFTSNGTLVSWVPLLLFVVLSGLSLDCHVLVLNRIRENARGGLPPSQAILEGVTKTAGVVTAAAAVMIVVFAIFGTLSFIELKQIGVGLAIATLLDVTLIRVVMLPAALAAFGRALWWPGRIEASADRRDGRSGDDRDDEPGRVGALVGG